MATKDSERKRTNWLQTILPANPEKRWCSKNGIEIGQYTSTDRQTRFLCKRFVNIHWFWSGGNWNFWIKQANGKNGKKEEEEICVHINQASWARSPVCVCAWKAVSAVLLVFAASQRHRMHFSGGQRTTEICIAILSNSFFNIAKPTEIECWTVACLHVRWRQIYSARHHITLNHKPFGLQSRQNSQFYYKKPVSQKIKGNKFSEWGRGRKSSMCSLKGKRGA